MQKNLLFRARTNKNKTLTLLLCTTWGVSKIDQAYQVWKQLEEPSTDKTFTSSLSHTHCTAWLNTVCLQVCGQKSSVWNGELTKQTMWKKDAGPVVHCQLNLLPLTETITSRDIWVYKGSTGRTRCLWIAVNIQHARIGISLDGGHGRLP